MFVLTLRALNFLQKNGIKQKLYSGTRRGKMERALEIERIFQ